MISFISSNAFIGWFASEDKIILQLAQRHDHLRWGQFACLLLMRRSSSSTSGLRGTAMYLCEEYLLITLVYNTKASISADCVAKYLHKVFLL